jgi:hypothetical protein
MAGWHVKSSMTNPRLPNWMDYLTAIVEPILSRIPAWNLTLEVAGSTVGAKCCGKVTTLAIGGVLRRVECGD